MAFSVPPAVARLVAKYTIYPARILHHHIPSLFAESATTVIDPPAVGDDLPARTPAAVSPPIRPMAQCAMGNPVISGASVDDFGRVDYVADPFLLPSEDGWHMFFEVYNRSKRPTAVIGHATDRGGGQWQYEGVILREDVHLSFPFVFRSGGEYYLVPDQQRSVDSAKVTLYRATTFPSEWEVAAEIVRPEYRTSDSVVFYWDERWWCLVGHEPSGSLYCYHSQTLEADYWQPHSENPVVSERPEASRPGGRPLVTPGGILIFYQDCVDRYGQSVSVKRIDRLSPEVFSEQTFQKGPVLEGTGRVGWRSGRMHHIDLWPLDHGFMCAVDGDIALGRNTWAAAQWSIGMFAWERTPSRNDRKQ